jgi:hypothetical protein
MKVSRGWAASSAVVLAAVALAAGPTPASAAYIVGPDASYETTEGNFNNIVFSHEDNHIQWVFSPDVFGDTAQTINGFSLRFDSVVTNFYGNSGVFALDPRFSVKLGTIDGLASTNFADNLGNAVTVLGGAQNVNYSIGGPSGVLKPWGVTLNFATPYTYDPAAGSLLIDLFVPGQDMYGTMDFVGDYYAAPTTETRGYRVFNLNAASSTGSLQVFTPVIRFDVSPAVVSAAPEPQAWALMLLGFAGLGTMLRTRRKLAAPVA